MTTKTPNLSEKQVSDLSPAARDAYFQQKADEGVDPSDGWLFGAVKQFIATGQAHQKAQEVGDKNVDDLTRSGDVQYVEGLEPSNADYQGYDHERLEQFVKSDLNVEQVTQVSTAYHDIHKAFESFATTMTEAVNASQGTWDGEAAGNAKGYFQSLSKWSEANSQNAKLASETIYDQGTAASHVKNTMPAPIPFSWKDEVGSWMTSNPFNLGENIDKSIQKQEDSREAHTQAASAMHDYDKALYEAASKQPVFAEPPKFGVGGGGGIDQPGPPHLRYDLPPGSTPPGGNTYIPPGNRGGGGGGGGGTGIPGTGHIPGPGASTGSGSIPSGTTPSGFQNTPAPISTPGPNTNMNSMPMGPMPMSPMMGGGMGDSEYNGRGGRSGGGSGFGPGSGASSTPGSGSASGAARPGGVGAAEAAAGRGMGGLGGGAGGRGGPGLGGGMGGRGQQSEGDEDTEHQRPTYLVEGDPDEVFGTDLRTAPPVIGE
ncbi:hypothetical protein SD37_40580 [Amycolatopsis orientalis]|uniref:PPE family domain-containing protein n=1 Tax=Amycolatopsis orientalis TaxID=31958 RepID=A0A193C9Y4_AMYOR|nr:hypothetical protein [Amycolatopsis orientalis]ANN21259.1 hypothetical protein SD37_40580 [Amycolatopsis orientalis]